MQPTDPKPELHEVVSLASDYRPKSRQPERTGKHMQLFMMGCLFLALIMFSAVAVFLFWSPEPKKATLSSASVLLFPIVGEIKEHSPESPLDRLLDRKELYLQDYLRMLEKAKKDDNVRGLWLQIEQNSLGMAQARELRGALEDFAKSGKTLISSGGFWGEKELYLGSVAHHIYLEPEAMVFFDGLASSTTFFGAFFQKYGIRVHVEAKGEYKSYADAYRYPQMTESNRLAIAELLKSIQDELIVPIAASRKLEPAQLEKAFAAPVYALQQAIEWKLIDGIKYADEIRAVFAKKLSVDDVEDLNVVEVGDYYSSEAETTWFGSKDKIAVIHARGAIYPGRARKGLFGDDVIGSESFIEQLKAARQDENVKAIVLRIDSPGGSALASDNMWREIRLTREMGKPVVGSMGNYAASGGYYMAMACEKIYAEPGTITGSIGIVAMRPDAEKLLQDLNLFVDVVKTAPSADFFDLSRGMTAQEVEFFRERIEEGYKNFVTKAAQSRGVSYETLEPHARGRVWTGRQALERGLVDQIGGLDEAISEAAKLAKLNNYRVVDLPKGEKDLMTLLREGASAQQSPSILVEMAPVVPRDLRFLWDFHHFGSKSPFEMLALTPTLIDFR